MRMVVDAPQPLRVDVAVHLGRREGAVAEELLDRAQIGAALEQMRRERMAQAMRMRNETAQGRGVETPAADGDEECILRASHELRARRMQVPRQQRRRLLAQRYDPVLRSFPLANV